MATTLGFHSLFIITGVGLSGLMSAAELIGIRRHNNDYIRMARRWSYGFAIMFGVGTASGTAVAFELYLLWPTFMDVAVKVVALPFFMEVVFAFFPEAIFLPIYYYGWNKFKKPIHHWLTSLPIVFGSALSGFFITTVNSFMNTPTGFSYTTGPGGTITSVYNVNPIAAMLNPATPWETSHVISATYVGTAFMLSAIYAYHLLKGRRNSYNLRAFKYSTAAGFISSIFAGITGSLSASFLSVFQPEKFAAMEDLLHTQSYAYEKFFSFTIPIRGLMSYLAAGKFSATMTGLNAFARNTWPDVVLVHSAFDIMAAAGFYFLLASLGTIIAHLFLSKYRRLISASYYAMLLAGPLAYLTFLMGWIVTEEGRQPWIIYNIMRVSQAFTTASSSVPLLFFSFLAFYVVLTTLTVIILVRYYREAPEQVEAGVGEHVSV
ncbi:MAG: cytochrome ubiquinol oxidase subunit I [Methanomassiliicoccales archaeon]